jgi:hypothetical protein
MSVLVLYLRAARPHRKMVSSSPKRAAQYADLRHHVHVETVFTEVLAHVIVSAEFHRFQLLHSPTVHVE